MRFYIILSIFLTLKYAYSTELLIHQYVGYNSDCLTDEIYGDFTIEEYNNLINRRKIVRTQMKDQLFRNEIDTLLVPVVFHDLHKLNDDGISNSYCNYISGFSITNFEYVTQVDQEICNNRLDRSLKVLNANYAPAGIKFQFHDNYTSILSANDLGFDGFYEYATAGDTTTPSADDFKTNYNIEHALNIYIVDFVNTRDGTSGISTYPWSSGKPGIFIKHGFLPGDVDAHASAEYDRTLMHEIGHYFGLLHINGIWYVKEGNTQRDLVSGIDCNEHGDLICDTPPEPGLVPLTSDTLLQSWHTNDDRECIYLGYGGEYNITTDTLKIGGYNKTYFSGYYPFFDYCAEWQTENFYGVDHCQLFTNYDDEGYFFGTKNLPLDCFNINQSEFATDCPISQYPKLPIGYNFMRAGSYPYNDCGFSPINDNIYYKEANSGFTPEQFANIRYYLEHDYTGCNNTDACNFDISSTHLLRFGESGCYYGSISSPGSNDCFEKEQCTYDCNDNSLSVNKTLIPDKYRIENIYPNPFNPSTQITYGLPEYSAVKISIYDVTGRQINTLLSEYQTAGFHSVIWEAINYSSGIYFINISSSNYSESQKIVLIK